MTRSKIELIVVIAAVTAAFSAAEIYAQARSSGFPDGRQRDPVRASVFGASQVYVSQQERLLINTGRVAPIFGAAGLIGWVVQRRRERPSHSK